MSRIHWRALVLVLVTAAALRTGAQAATLEERFEHTYPLAAGGTFTLGNVNGAVEVASWDRAGVRVTATKHVRAGSEERAKELLKALEIRVTPGAGQVRVDTRYPQMSNGFWSWLAGGGTEASVAYHVDVPRQVRLKLETVNGAVLVRGTEGQASLQTVNGRLRAEGVRGHLELETTNGAIAVTGGAGAVHASTTNGAIDVQLAVLPPGDRLQLETTNGAVTLRMPRGARASLEAETVNGAVESDLPIAARGKVGRHHLAGDLNGGGGKIEISTTNGGIHLQESRR